MILRIRSPIASLYLISAFAAAAVSWIGSFVLAQDEKPAAFQVEPGIRQLFLDDVGVEKIDGLKHTMHQPRKRGAVIRSSNPEQTIQTRTAPVWDPASKLFKFWVLGIDDKFWQSPDGLHWVPDRKRTCGPTWSCTIRMMPIPHGDSRRRLLNEGFAVSADGAQWTKLDVPKIPSSDEGNFSYDPKHGLFIQTVKLGGPHGRAVAIATSKDFKTWTDHGIVFSADKLDQELGAQEHRRAATGCLAPANAL